MANAYYRGKRVSVSHAALLNAYERKYGAAVQLNQGRRTLAEQTRFWLHYLRYGHPLAARPWGGAPHIKWNAENHALDINAGHGRGQAQHVAAFYRSLGIPVAFNVSNEPWHMDVLSKDAIVRASRRYRWPTLRPYKARGKQVLLMKRLLWARGVRGFDRRTSGYGKNAVAAVKRFQRKRGLKPDGLVGPATWKALGRK